MMKSKSTKSKKASKKQLVPDASKSAAVASASARGSVVLAARDSEPRAKDLDSPRAKL